MEVHSNNRYNFKPNFFWGACFCYMYCSIRNPTLMMSGARNVGRVEVLSKTRHAENPPGGMRSRSHHDSVSLLPCTPTLVVPLGVGCLGAVPPCSHARRY